MRVLRKSFYCSHFLRLYSVALPLALLCLFVSLTVGCAPAFVPFDATGIRGAERVGYFAWRGNIMIDGVSSKRGLFDDRKRAIENIEESDIFNVFKSAFINEFEVAKGVNIKELDRYQRVLKDGKVDVISSARSQGFDVVLETELSTNTRTNNYGSYIFATADVTATRVSDGKILWKASKGGMFDKNYELSCPGYSVSAIFECGSVAPTLAKKIAKGLVQ
jgi:hypothetical protein